MMRTKLQTLAEHLLRNASVVNEIVDWLLCNYKIWLSQKKSQNPRAIAIQRNSSIAIETADSRGTATTNSIANIIAELIMAEQIRRMKLQIRWKSVANEIAERFVHK